MEIRVSDKNWRTTVILFHLLGILGVHRFYVGKTLTGLLWLFTGGGLAVGVIVDCIMLYTGNFTDADGALILPDSKRLMLQAIARMPTEAQPQAAERGTIPVQADKFVINMSRIKPEDNERIKSITEYFACGLVRNGDSMKEMNLRLVRDGKVIEEKRFSDPMPSGMELFGVLGARAVLVGYDIRSGIPAIGKIMQDADVSANWDYVDLKELAEYDAKPYTDPESAESRAEKAISFFENMRVPGRYDFVIPSRRDGQPRAYLYTVPFRVTDEEALCAAAEKKKFTFTAKDENGEIVLLSGKTPIGILLDRQEMLRDWIQRADPYLICLERAKDGEGTAKLAFYRDRRRGQEWRKQTVVGLTHFTDDEHQFAMSGMEPGDELELEEDFEEDNVYDVTYQGLSIGRLPASTAKKLEDADPYGVFLDGFSTTDSGVEKPFVRIFW